MPEWLDGFQKQLRKRSDEFKETGIEFQSQFYSQIKKYKGSETKTKGPSYKLL